MRGKFDLVVSSAAVCSLRTHRLLQRLAVGHALDHVVNSGHEVIRSFELDEDWLWDYWGSNYIDGPELAELQSHPADQSVRGPSELVPRDWVTQLTANRVRRNSVIARFIHRPRAEDGTVRTTCTIRGSEFGSAASQTPERADAPPRSRSRMVTIARKAPDSVFLVSRDADPAATQWLAAGMLAGVGPAYFFVADLNGAVLNRRRALTRTKEPTL